MSEISTVRENLMNEKGYSPFCGRFCSSMPRTVWCDAVSQFKCPVCDWLSVFPEDFIRRYKNKWSLA